MIANKAVRRRVESKFQITLSIKELKDFIMKLASSIFSCKGISSSSAYSPFYKEIFSELAVTNRSKS